MKRSTSRILTTHTGSLPRSSRIVELVMAQEEAHQGAADTTPEEMADALQDEVSSMIQRQVESGIDVVSDGEASKHSYARYVRHRLSGFSDADRLVLARAADIAEFPEFGAFMTRVVGESGARAYKSASCIGPIERVDHEAVDRDIERVKAATAGLDVEAFMTAASPGVIALNFEDEYYGSHEEYLVAIADAMREEYQAITDAGLILQIDCPDLAMGAHGRYRDFSLEEFRKLADLHVEVINHATSGIDPEQMRMHICWGNYPGPHTHDIPLADILDIALRARPVALLLEAANPRHAHEWRVFEDYALPEEKILIPGVIDSTSNYVEHPEVVAERLRQYTRVVGQERVIAGTDCGFGTSALAPWVVPEVVWRKLQSLSEGARLASE